METWKNVILFIFMIVAMALLIFGLVTKDDHLAKIMVPSAISVGVITLIAAMVMYSSD